jgi:hypothetical protein
MSTTPTDAPRFTDIRFDFYALVKAGVCESVVSLLGILALGVTHSIWFQFFVSNPNACIPIQTLTLTVSALRKHGTTEA